MGGPLKATAHVFIIPIQHFIVFELNIYCGYFSLNQILFSVLVELLEFQHQQQCLSLAAKYIVKLQRVQLPVLHSRALSVWFIGARRGPLNLRTSFPLI